MALIDEFDGGEIDLSQIPGFESLADQHAAEEPEDDEDENDEGGDEDDEEELGSEGKPKKKPQVVSKKEYETLKSQFDELNGRIKALTERPPTQPQIVYQQPPQQMTPDQLQAQRARLEQEFYQDPIGTNQRIAAATAQNQFGGLINDMRETLAQQSIQAYRANLMQDPQFEKAAATYFDQQVASLPKNALATLPPAKLQELLQFAEDAAWGKVMKQVRTNQKKGNGGATSGANNQRTTPGSQNRPQQREQSNTRDHESKLAKVLGLSKSDFEGIIE